ncbi:MAG: IMP dehydrogenase [Verrucomicrobiales bacterium]|jgi:IMP dehydrogenase|nr:IMP dehydrogenase [Verrucomicrobiales bacterium]
MAPKHRPTPKVNKNRYYLNAGDFFESLAGRALTYDDVSLATNYSEILPRQTKLETRLSDSLRLQLPIISSDMDTVTEAEMAIGMALNGGLGLIHYNMTERQQVKQVARVKNHVHGLIQEPITVKPSQRIGDVLAMIGERGYKFSTFPVAADDGTLAGLLFGHVVRERYAGKTVSEAMAPRKEVFTVSDTKLGGNPIATADKFFNDHMGIHKLLVVDKNDKIRGMFTLSDIERITGEAGSHHRAARDDKFRLVCGVAISAPRVADGGLDVDRILAHLTNLTREGVDAVAISTAHGHTVGVGETVRLVRRHFPALTIIAGNVTSAEGVEFLAKAGADAVKVGQGPGSICTTRVVAGVGVPQLTALYVGSRLAKKNNVRVIADGGITKSGDIVKALTIADAVICGGMLAGCKEAPGKIIEINGKSYKQYRGMGSMEAMKAGSAARYGHESKDLNRKATAEGVEALKEVSGSLDEVLAQLAGGIQSGMGYLGAADLDELKRKARFVRVTTAGQREASPHDIIEIKTTQG